MDKVFLIDGGINQCKGVLDKIKNSFTDYEIFTFDSEDPYEYVSQMICELSCFGSDRLFLIKELPSINAPSVAQSRTKVLSRFKKLFNNIPRGNVIIFYRVGVSAESFLKEIRKHGQVYLFSQKINKNEAIKKINTYFNKKNIIIDSDTSSLVVNSINVDAHEVDIEKLSLLLKKIYNYTYGKKKITKDDIYLICSDSKDFVVWNLYNFLDDKNYCSAIQLMNDYFENCYKNINIEASLLLNGMLWRYGLLLIAKSSVEIGEKSKDIKQKILNIKKLESKGKAYKIKMNMAIKDNKPVNKYSDKMIISILNGYGGRSSINSYSLDTLSLIYFSIVKSLIKIRIGCEVSEVKNIIRIIILVICSEISKKNIIDNLLQNRAA